MAIAVNERAWDGVPKMSGSSVFENMLCKARFKASQKFKDYDTSDATQGTLLHGYMENGTPVDEILDSSHAFLISECRRMEDQVTKEFGLHGDVTREPRLWLMNEKDEGILSGQIDYLEIDGEDASILDYKMLYGHYEEAPKNKQLQVYATLVFENYPDVQRVFVALLQPALGKWTKAVMHRDLSMILKEKLLKLAEEVEQEDAEMTAGHLQCKYCKALAHCPAAFEYLKNETIEKIDMENISNEELAEKMAIVGLIERFGKSVKSTAKNRLESGINIPGYKLRNTGSVTSFDAVGASEILFSANLPVAKFLQATKISEPDLIQIWADHTDQSKADAKKDLRTRLEQVMFRKEKAKSVSNA
jgi:hypothetical protein